MWSVNNSTQYTADRGWVRDYTGREVWLVAVRARFRIKHGAEAFWDPDLPQDPVKIAPEFSGSGVACRLLADSDLVQEKLRTDVLMVGYARPARGHLATKLVVRMAVGTIDKRVAVFGDRIWAFGGPSDPKPFDSMPLDYSRAFGGVRDPEGDWYPRNPAGVGYAKDEHEPARRLPNLEDPAALIRSWGDLPSPAAFGPIAPHWPQRQRFAGTYDAAWERDRQPLLPTDFSPRFHQQAPEDQQAEGYLRGGERVRLEGVHPDGPLEFNLPRVSLAFQTEFDDLFEAMHDARLHTVVFEPDFPAVSMVWHTSLECHSRVTLLRETLIWERSRVPASPVVA